MIKNELLCPKVLIYQAQNDTEIISEYLSKFDLVPISVTEAELPQKLHEGNFDICLFSLSPDNDRLKPLKLLKAISANIPCIILSEETEYYYIIKAFNYGADDYITIPYNMDELVCRLKAVLKRYNIRTRSIKPFYYIGSYILETENRLLIYTEEHRPDIITRLTEKETKIISLLCEYKNELLPRELLLQSIQKYNSPFTNRSFYVYMSKIRSYLKLDSSIQIKTLAGEGFMLVVNDNK